MPHLAQAYIHLKPYNASDRQMRALGRSAKQLAVRIAGEIYGGGVDVEIELEEGSLRTRVTVIGSLLIGIYGGVANYKGFKESVRELCDDARAFSVDLCAPFVKKAGATDDQLYRFERRLKTPGKLYRLSKRLERLEKHTTEISPRDMAKELAAARHELSQLQHDLSPSELEIVERNLAPKILPPPNKWPKLEPPKAAIRREVDQALMFDLNKDSDEEHPRRLVYKARAKVPDNKRPIVKPHRHSAPDLLRPSQPIS